MSSAICDACNVVVNTKHSEDQEKGVLYHKCKEGVWTSQTNAYFQCFVICPTSSEPWPFYTEIKQL